MAGTSVILARTYSLGVRDSRDTSASAREAQLAVFRRLDPVLRLALACQMSDETRAITEAGLRHRHPAWPSDRIRNALRDLLIGDSLTQELGSRRRPLGP